LIALFHLMNKPHKQTTRGPIDRREKK